MIDPQAEDGQQDDGGEKGVPQTAVTVVRHGEGAHNVNTSGILAHSRAMLRDLLAFRVSGFAEHGKEVLYGTMRAYHLRDPELTDRGITQAQLAGQGTFNHHFDAVVVSPMLRTIMTAIHMFKQHAQDGQPVKLRLHPACCETRTLLEGSNAGRYKADLKAVVDGILAEGEYSGIEVDYSEVPEGRWWVGVAETGGQLERRADSFRAFLATRKWRTVAVVSHATFLHFLTAKGDYLTTGEWRTYTCTPGSATVDPSGPSGRPCIQAICARPDPPNVGDGAQDPSPVEAQGQ